MKNVDQLARSRAKDHRTSLLGPFIETQYRVLGMRARSFPRLLDFYVQYWMRSAILRNHLK